MRRLVIGLMLALMVLSGPAAAEGLTLEAKIPLGGVKGRIDHMAADPVRRRLFVAELGNDSLAIVDLAAGRLLQRVDGLAEPQGVAYDAARDTVFVANGGDGSLRLLVGEALAPVGRIDVGRDADNVRLDASAGWLYVGYGGGALAVIDPRSRARLADIALPRHPESFQIDPVRGRIYVNLPGAGAIAVLDRVTGKSLAAWHPPGLDGNFPMALDPAAAQVVVAFRRPARLVAFAAADGTIAAGRAVCGDADDLFLDERRRRFYVSCGEGFIDVFAAGDDTAKLAHVATTRGARTSLFVPELDRLYLAVPAGTDDPAAIWVFRPE